MSKLLSRTFCSLDDLKNFYENGTVPNIHTRDVELLRSLMQADCLYKPKHLKLGTCDGEFLGEGVGKEGRFKVNVLMQMKRFSSKTLTWETCYTEFIKSMNGQHPTEGHRICVIFFCLNRPSDVTKDSFRFLPPEYPQCEWIICSGKAMDDVLSFPVCEHFRSPSE